MRKGGQMDGGFGQWMRGTLLHFTPLHLSHLSMTHIEQATHPHNTKTTSQSSPITRSHMLQVHLSTTGDYM